MKLVYTHPSGIVVAQARSALQLAGIDTVLRNEYAAGAMGELAPIDTWPELWVVNDRDYELAASLLEESRNQGEAHEWRCEKCGRSSPDTFEWCWHCGTERVSG